MNNDVRYSKVNYREQFSLFTRYFGIFGVPITMVFVPVAITLVTINVVGTAIVESLSRAEDK